MEPKPLVERDVELEAVRATVHGAVQGAGGALLIRGPAGVGKSALLEHARLETSRTGVETFSARCGALERHYPFGVVRQLFAQVAHRDPAVLAGAAQAALPALGLSSDAAEDGDHYAHSHGLYWLLSNIAERSPVVLIVDDLQWSDEPSLRFLVFLLKRIADLPIAVIGAVRDTEADTLMVELLADPSMHIVEPGVLSADASAALVRSHTGGRATRAFETACYDATGGNPHLLSELLIALAADHMAPDDATAKRVPAMTPAGVLRSVLIRLSTLDLDAALLAHAIVVLGSSVDLRHAAALAGIDADRATTLVDDLVRISLLAPGRPLDVIHPLIGEVLRADIGDAERRRLHRGAATLLHEDGADVARIATHLDHTDPAADPWVVEVLRRAAGRARAEGAPDAARRWLERAVREGVAEDRVALLVELAEVTIALGEAPVALGHAQHATEVAQTARDRAAATLALAHAYSAVHDFDAGIRILEHALTADDADTAAVLPLRIELAWMLAGTAGESAVFGGDDFAKLEQLDASDPSGGEALVHVGVWHLVHGRGAESAKIARRVSADVPRFVRALTDQKIHSVVDQLIVTGEIERARHVIDAWLERSQQRGSIHGYALANIARSFLGWRTGEMSMCDTSAEVALTSGVLVLEEQPLCLSLRAMVALERGDATTALALADEALTLSSAGRYHFASYARARVLRAAGRFADAAAELARIAELDATVPGPLAYPDWRLESAELALARGDRDETRTMLEAHQAYLRAFDTATTRGVHARICALASTGAERISGLEMAASVMADAANALERARTLVALGAALRGAGRREEAQERLRAATDLATTCGATALAEQALDELKASGARPRRVRVTGVESLTGAERRVAEAAAEGKSNAQVAQALFLTRSTVEKHLTSAYRKLGITSRAELDAALSG